MILKYASLFENNYTGDCTWHIISGVEDVKYGHYLGDKLKPSMTKEEADAILKTRPDNFITYLKEPVSESSQRIQIILTGATEAFLMTNEGKTIERIR